VNAATNLIVGKTDVHPLVTSPAPGNYIVCGQSPVAAGATVILNCSASYSTPAQYVVVQSTAITSLSLCEVEVYTPEGWFEQVIFVAISQRHSAYYNFLADMSAIFTVENP